VVEHHDRRSARAALAAAARLPFGALVAAIAAARLADPASAEGAGALALVVFLGCALLAAAWRRSISHMPVLRMGYPLLVAGVATTICALLADDLHVSGLSATDWLYVLVASAVTSMLTGAARAKGRRPHRTRVAFIGGREAAERLASDLARARVGAYELTGRIDAFGDDGGTVRVIGELGALRETILHERIDLLVLGSGVGRLTVFETLAGSCLDLRIQISELSAFYEDAFGHVPTSEINAAWFAHLVDAHARRPSTAAKRTLDVSLGLALGLLALPVLAVAAALIRRDGPAIFVQQRIGEGGRPFRLYKLRTMRVAAGDEAVWAQEGDPRVTRIGRLLRRFHIDELPQLWNVLRGEMSLVGPRPEQLEFVERLEATLPFYQRRHLIRPGLTGWAQVRCGYAGTYAGAAWKLCNDLYYVKYRSMGLDVLLLLETAGLLAVGSAAVVGVPVVPHAGSDAWPDAAAGDGVPAAAAAVAPPDGVPAIARMIAGEHDEEPSLIR
jgi:exopolysaccharide biosynthesis polyprenyl glycosylphosphotransferase